MRKVSLVVVFVLLAHCVSSQTRPWHALKKVEGSYYAEFNGDEFHVNPSVVTVKFKNGITQSTIPLDIIRTNRLGFIDITVPQNTDLVEFLDSLQNSNDFNYVHYNTFGKFCSNLLPNDPHLNKQWYLDAINILEAWNLSTGSSSVKVAIPDAAPDWRHPDIGNVDSSLAWNYLKDNNNETLFFEHGSMILGQISAKTNNATGIAKNEK